MKSIRSVFILSGAIALIALGVAVYLMFWGPDRIELTGKSLSELLENGDLVPLIVVGPVLVVRPYCHNDHYWQVYFDGNRTIRESLAEAGFPSPMPAQMVVVQNQ